MQDLVDWLKVTMTLRTQLGYLHWLSSFRVDYRTFGLLR